MNHKDLDVWKAGMALTIDVYQLTNSFPKEELYGLVSQMRRSAVSIPSNIAEGAARNSGREFVQFLYIALGSLAELETQIMIAEKLGYADNVSMLFKNIAAVRQMLLGLIKHQKRKAADKSH